MILLGTVFLPIVLALVCAFLPAGRARSVALLGMALELVAALYTCIEPMRLDYAWAPAAGISFSLASDGVSGTLLALGALVTGLAIIATRVETLERPRLFLALLLLVQGGVAGVVLARDLVQFFVFWDLVLVPFLLLIGLFGEGDRRAAALKLLIYTGAGSLALLLAIAAIGVARGPGGGFAAGGSFAIDPGLPLRFSASVNFLGISVPDLVFLGLAFAFMVKTPVVPFHGWLADAYTSAPTPAVMVLAGVVSKLGPYGFYRIALTLLPGAASHLSGLMMVLAAAGILWGALLALRQTDAKRLLAYLSLSHMGFITLGLFTLTPEGVSGAALQMVNHGILISSLFFIVAHIEARTGTRDRSQLRGLGGQAPLFAGVFFVLALATLGLPGLNGFVGEYFVMLGTYLRSWWLLAAAATGVILASWYTLRLYQGLMTGPRHRQVASVEAGREELMILLPPAMLAVLIGVYPAPLLTVIGRSVAVLFGARP